MPRARRCAKRPLKHPISSSTGCVSPTERCLGVAAVAARQGTDAALALAAAQVIVAEGLYDAAYVAEQTDLPISGFKSAWEISGNSAFVGDRQVPGHCVADQVT